MNVEKKNEEKNIDEGDKDVDKDLDEDEKKPEQEEVATIEMLGFSGEGALIAGEEIELCTATVTVSSEKCVLLRLKQSNFLKLMETNKIFTRTEENDTEGDDDNKSIIEQMKETRRERSQSNRLLMQNRNSGDLLGGGASTNTRSLFYDSGLSNTNTTGVDL